MIHIIVDQQMRIKILKWLSDRTTATFESGCPVWPCNDIACMETLSVMRMSKEGLSMVFKVDKKSTSSISHGERVSIRRFCEMSEELFPGANVIKKIASKTKHKQMEFHNVR